MKLLIRGIQIVVSVLLTLLLLANISIALLRLTTGEVLPKLFGYSHALVLSGSMEPAFSAGDMLIIQAQDSYKTGDIVIYTHGDILITHRIVGEEGTTFITQGDANNAPDSDPVTIEQVEGQVVAVIPSVGLVVQFFKTPFGILVLVAMGLVLIELPRWNDRRKYGSRRSGKRVLNHDKKIKPR